MIMCDKYNIVGIVQCYNEIKLGNLPRFLRYIKQHVRTLVAFDDGSTDGSYELLCKATPHVIRNTKNDFKNELQHRQLMLETEPCRNADFILWLDCDEILCHNADLQQLCEHMITNNIDGVTLHEVNLWRSKTYHRKDNSFADGWFTRLWRMKPNVRFPTAKGLHQSSVPLGLQNIQRVSWPVVIHYGFASFETLSYKFFNYRAHGQTGDSLYRLIQEVNDECTNHFNPGKHIQFDIGRVNRDWLPPELWDENETPPTPLPFVDMFREIHNHRLLTTKPQITFICLIYKSVKWMKFVYEQCLKYTCMDNANFLFVANDATQEVLDTLKNNHYPHVVFNNTIEDRKEWYINNVYRAWNFGAKCADGDYIVFLNSDMAFTPQWFEHLFAAKRSNNVVCSRLVESGRYKSGRYGIERNFGKGPDDYEEDNFIEYARGIQKHDVHEGGLYMPLLIRKDDFLAVGGFPEGNVRQGTPIDVDIPIIAGQGEPCISGDKYFMQRLDHILGVKHVTVFDSIVYHFQEGEMHDSSLNEVCQDDTTVAICNDFLSLSKREKVLWEYLMDMSPGHVALDIPALEKIYGTVPKNDWERLAAQEFMKHQSGTKICLQNASFMGSIPVEKESKLVYLQDNFRKMRYDTNIQLHTLRDASYLATNSVEMAAYYPEFNLDIIPIGVNADLFCPCKDENERHSLRKMFDLPADAHIAIFVGAFNATKGWPTLEPIICERMDIFWVLVSKIGTDKCNFANTRTYNQIDQTMLSNLLKCADFYVNASPSESLCLAALEAAFCDLPIIMPPTGFVMDFPHEIRQKLGVITRDISYGIDEVLKYRLSPGYYTPRKLVMGSSYNLIHNLQLWESLFQRVKFKMDSHRLYRCDFH